MIIPIKEKIISLKRENYYKYLFIINYSFYLKWVLKPLKLVQIPLQKVKMRV